MTERDNQTQAAGFRLEDVYFVLFRHKWMILGFSLAGILAAGGAYFFKPPIYESEAKLLVRYVQENRSASPVDSEAQFKSPDARGEGIISSELEILSSLDLAVAVADIIGPERILAKVGGGSNRMQAAGMVRGGLLPEVPRKGNVIRILYQHPDPEVVQPVLRQLIESYKKKHLEIHRGIGILDDFLSRQTDEFRSRLNQTDDNLRALKLKFGVVSLEDTKRGYSELLSRIREEMFAAEAELAERKAAIAELEKAAPSKSEAAATDLGVPLEKLNEYKSVCAQLPALQKSERDLLGKFTEENSMVKRVRERMAQTEERKMKLEQEHPKLASLGIGAAPVAGTSLDLGAENSRLRVLEAKMRVLAGQLDKIRAEAADLSKAESSIGQLERQKALEEANLLSFSKSLERARQEENLGPGRITNLNVVQAPSPPRRNRDELNKLLLTLLGAGTGVGLALAFGLELFLDQSVKRASEVQTRLGLPLFFSVPALALGKKQRRLTGSPRKALPGPEASPDQEPSHEVAVWNGHSQLRPYLEALRDRLVYYFESRNMTHKPKLVAVTGCAAGLGTSTVASALAASLAEGGDGNILLVDMNSEKAATYSFLKDKPACGLPEALESDTRQAAQIGDKLYVASAGDSDDALPRILPKQFTQLMPKMKASDFDFIVFDLPAVSQTSVSARLAGYMDLVLLVVEAQKTNREAAKRAAALLGETGAHVNVVLNKTRTYVPAWLHQEM